MSIQALDQRLTRPAETGSGIVDNGHAAACGTTPQSPASVCAMAELQEGAQHNRLLARADFFGPRGSRLSKPFRKARDAGRVGGGRSLLRRASRSSNVSNSSSTTRASV